uniref:Sushi domain-containing protein n=1 Tax=Castor canadensis TaxID=51338 RepID=A0A8C0W9Y9_CASCN
MQTTIYFFGFVLLLLVGLCDFPQINHGILYDEKKYKPSFPVSTGKFFYYSCEYSFVSPSKLFWTQITCTEEGWSPTPKCLRLCFFPSVENGHSVSSGKTHLEGDIVQIFCNSGYSLQNNEKTISCTERGWSTPPMCISTRQVQSCGPPPQLPNGKIKEIQKEEYRHSEVVEYECNPNCTMKGPQKIQCMDGEWTILPTCVEETKTCGNIPKLENDITSFPLQTYPPGSTVNYRCQSFYELQGSAVITCSNGQWSQPPKCLDACVISEENMNKNNIQLKWKSNKRIYVKTGNIVEFACKSTFKAKTSVQSFQAICKEGKFEYPICE